MLTVEETQQCGEVPENGCRSAHDCPALLRKRTSDYTVHMCAFDLEPRAPMHELESRQPSQKPYHTHRI